MDLVDIDKVLDDLELNESDIPSGSVILQKDTKKSDKNNLTNENNTKQRTIQDNNVKNDPIDDRSKKFVAVSHVFSSLDEYRRDIEGLEEDIKRLENNKTTETIEIPDNCTPTPNIAIKESPEPDEPIKIASEQLEQDDDEPTEEYQDEGDCLTSASSITTSSPSSFSSGPSPGSSSESCSFISGTDYTKPEQDQGDTNKQQDNTLENCKNDNKNYDETKNDDDSKKSEQEQSADVGLSSISSCLYNENTSSSLPGLSHDIIKIDALSSISSHTRNIGKTSEQLSTNNHENINNHQAGCHIQYPSIEPKIDDAASLQKHTPKVVGFGSTMDEISDTELDSILQEIDSDLQGFCPVINNNDIINQIAQPTTAVAALAEAEEIPTEPTSVSIEEATCDTDVIVDSKRLEDDDNNLQNADSFSQASTIEFAELRLQSDFGTDALADERSTSSNSGTKNDQRIDFINSPTGSDEPEDLGKPDTDNIPKNLQLTEIAKPQLQRPNSLDLPISRPIEININSTAGQTPPASRMEDACTLSSSSSEEIQQQQEQPQQQSQPQQQQQQQQQQLAGSAGGMQDVWTEPEQQNFPPEDAGAPDTNKLGKVPPFWIPDSAATACMQCKQKFSLIKRRHHCRACGQVLCSVCCSQKAKLEFLGETEVRVCVQCHLILSEHSAAEVRSSGQSSNIPGRSPNPNNPMEYCSVIPPHQQVSQSTQSPISVMVPVGVLKREGSTKNGRKDKNVIFSDGIRPGCDLTELDNSWDDNKPGSSSSYRKPSSKRVQTPIASNTSRSNRKTKPLPICDENESYIPKEPNALPPIYVATKGDYDYKEIQNNSTLIERLQTETLKFAVQRNFYVFVKIVKLKCCINKTIINFTTFGMHHVGQDEIVILLELDNSGIIPKDIFIHLNEIYRDADKGHPITELGFSMPKLNNFLGSREHGGFLYIRATFQCLQEIHLPESPFLIGILIHRWEVPWAKIFPLRLMLRLGAQYRYYPSPHISIRGRDSVYAEIAQTIINFLADFRNYSYTLATIRGMYIHMEDRKTSILIPKNRYDQVLKALNNSSDHILALGGNFSKKADGHLVCIQNMESDCPETHTYSTQAINIQGQPRKVTGASFIVLNGALKTTSGLSGKCSIVEDGLMVQILPAKMSSVRTSLKNMKDVEIVCGPVDADQSQTEVVTIKWTGSDLEFNIGVKSPIDSKKMDGIPSIRVHAGLNYSNPNHTIRWTEVFIIQSDEESAHGKDPIDMSKLSEQIAKSTSTALLSFLDLLAANGCFKIGLRATLHQDNVSYEAGSQNNKLAPIYMNALDNELIPTLHKQATSLEIDTPIILELIFHILDK